MSKVKTITVTSTEQEITLDATYQFMWFRNLGDNDCYVSDHSGIVAGADDVALCKAGECVRIKFPYVDTNYRESYDIITNGMSRDAVNDLIMSISAEIYQFYLSL